jgi:transposase
LCRKEEKLLVVALRDGGMSSDGIATHTAVSKSNIEKWVSEKV